MTCKRCTDSIPLAVGGDLPIEDQRRFEEHLRGCLTCFREVHRYRTALGELDSIRVDQEAAAPDGLFESIMAKVHANEPGPAAEYRARFDVPFEVTTVQRLRRLIPFAAAILIFAVFSGNRTSTGRFGVSPVLTDRGAFPTTPLPPLGLPPMDYLRPVGDRIGDANLILPVHRHVGSGGIEFVAPTIRRAKQIPPARHERTKEGDF